MAAYNFQAQFASLIESGAKRSTIRKRRKNGYIPSVGEQIRLYNGMRTKAVRLLREVVVTRVTPIIIETDGRDGRVILESRQLSNGAILTMALADGFINAAGFLQFFREKYGESVSAYLIEW